MKMLPIFSGLVLGLAMTVAATAQGIPEGVKTKELRGLEGPSVARGISNVTIGATPLAAEGLASLSERNLRARYWKILSDGIVPLHDHEHRPATIFTLQGEIFEYRNDVRQSLLHKEGGLSLEEGHHLAHWWINRGNEDVRLIAFDTVLRGKNAPSVDLATVPAAPTGFALPDAEQATMEIVGFVDLEKHFQGEIGQGLALTHSVVTIEPGGVFPLWTQPGQPAVMFVETGAVLETRSDADAALVIPPENGSVIADGVAAYWSNPTLVTAVLHVGAIEPISATAGVSNPTHSN